MIAAFGGKAIHSISTSLATVAKAAPSFVADRAYGQRGPDLSDFAKRARPRPSDGIPPPLVATKRRVSRVSLSTIPFESEIDITWYVPRFGGVRGQSHSRKFM